MPDNILPNGAPASKLISPDPLVEEQVSQEGNAASRDAEASAKDHQLPCLVVEKDIVLDLLPSIGQDADTGEGQMQMQYKAANVQFSRLKETVFHEEQKAGRVETRAKQAVLHLSHTQVRIETLEKAIKKLQDDLYDKPRTELMDPDWAIKHPIHKHELRRSTWATFRVNKQTYDAPTESIPALEALYPHGTYSTTSQQLPEPLPKSSNPSEGYHSPKLQTPERLRIRARSLLHHLIQVTGENIEINDHFDDQRGTLHSGTVFLRPFKLFVEHENEIRESLINLKLKIEKEPQLTEQPTEDGGRYARMKTPQFRNQDLLKNLELLIDFLDHDLKPTLGLRRAIASASATEIEFTDLWHLFKRGTLVVYRSEERRTYRVINFTGGREPLIDVLPKDGTNRNVIGSPSHEGFVIDCMSLSCDGSDYVPQLHRFVIPRYNGPRPINALSVVPLAFLPNPQSIRIKLLKRGRQFLELNAPPFSHRMMTGKTVDEPSHEVDAQVIIDMTVATTTIPEWKLTTKIDLDDLTEVDLRETYANGYCKHASEGCCGDDIIFKDLAVDQRYLRSYAQDNGPMFGPRLSTELEEDDILLLPDSIHGYVLRNRQWVTMRLSDLSEVRFQNDFNDLMLSENNKETILALVQTHESTRIRGAATSVGKGIDLVKGKGTGLILLLHGAPGVGKTSTAECVADRTKRPLYPITCGDIGETAMEVEKNLLQNFNLAHKWGCVLLLDEADIFLAKRNMTDLRRNAVTSVFLRSLEYYAGILFLTTNRVGSIDPAFKSRIHMSIYYPRLKKEDTVRLYETFIRRTRAEQDRLGISSFKINKKEILKFAKNHFREMEKGGLETWNGRQIRNAFQAAIALVEHESQQAGQSVATPSLGAAQFNAVAKSSKEFDEYLVSTLGETETDAAQREAWRADLGRSYRAAKNKRVSQPRDGRGKRLVEADTDENSSSSSSSDEDDDDDVDDFEEQKPLEDGGGTLKGGQSDAGQALDAEKFEQWQQFLKFQEMQKKTG